MKLRIQNHYRDDYDDFDVPTSEVRQFIAKKFPWVDASQDLQSVFEEINDCQAYSIETVPDVEKAEQSPEDSAGVAAAMLGHNADRDQTVETAFWLAGKPVDWQAYREALWQEDGDVEKAALRAAGLDTTDDSLSALRALLVVKGGELRKSGDIQDNEQNVDPPKRIRAGTPDALRFGRAVERGFKAGSFELVNLGGRHSAHSAILKDPETGNRYLMKPASGGVGPAAGVHEEPASQARREAAYSHIAESVFGMQNFVSEAELLDLDGKEWAAINLLPLDWKNLDKVKKRDPQRIQRIMNTLRQSGLLHRWAVMDYVLGNPDRHAGNLMVSPDDHVRLIDHGSAFAGPDFNPGQDRSSFVPFYLRYTVSTGQFNSMDAATQLGHMPVLNEGSDAELRQWIHGLDARKLATQLQHFGVRVDASAARLELVQSLVADRRAMAPQVNGLWLT